MRCVLAARRSCRRRGLSKSLSSRGVAVAGDALVLLALLAVAPAAAARLECQAVEEHPWLLPEAALRQARRSRAACALRCWRRAAWQWTSRAARVARSSPKRVDGAERLRQKFIRFEDVFGPLS